MCNAAEIIDIAFNHQFSLIKRAGKWERIENSGRRRTEKAVFQATKNWEQTFDAVPDLIAIIDNECRIVRTNRAMAARLRMTQEECVGLSCYRALHGMNEQPSFCPHKRVLEDGLEYLTESHEEVLGGDFVLSISPIYDPDGKVTGCVHVARDITESKRAEEAFRQSEERERARSDELAVVLDAVPAAVWITHDPRALQISGNRLSYEWLRLPEGANASKSAPEGERPETFRMFKDGLELKPEEMPVQMSAAGKEIHNYEFDIVYLDGTTRHILGNARPLRDQQGNPTGSISAFIDITERKRAEEAKRLSEAQKMAHLGNWDLNLVTRKLYWSDEIYRIFGLEPQEFGATYDAFLSCVHPEDRYYVEKAVIEALNGKPYSIDHRIILTNREERILHEQGEVIFDEGNNPILMKGTVQDITERKKVEEALEKIERIRIKEIHHRIKNNLQVISSLLDLQAETFQDKEVLEAFRESQNRVVSMSLIHEELYKGEGTDALDFSAYLRKLAEKLFQTYSLSGKNIHMYMDLEENTFFDMDIAVPLGIIVNELVSNSLKHAFPEKEGEIRIQLRREEKKNDVNRSFFSLIISDNGIGIPEDVELASFESLGMKLVNTLVDQLDGKIELIRAPGTEFIITFNVTERSQISEDIE